MDHVLQGTTVLTTIHGMQVALLAQALGLSNTM